MASLIEARVRSEGTAPDEIVFDAAPWFARATAKQLRDLAAAGWSSDVAADAVALACAAADTGLASFLARLERAALPRLPFGDDPGALEWECAIDRESALRWIARERPDTLEHVRAAEDEGYARAA